LGSPLFVIVIMSTEELISSIELFSVSGVGRLHSYARYVLPNELPLKKIQRV
jgi:hypothetical protein